MADSDGKAGRRRVTFTLQAPEAREVMLCGSFNGWDHTKHPMKREGSGLWKAQLMLAPGKYEYRLRVDGRWTDDPAAEERVANPFGTYNAVRKVGATTT